LHRVTCGRAGFVRRGPRRPPTRPATHPPANPPARPAACQLARTPTRPPARLTGRTKVRFLLLLLFFFSFFTFVLSNQAPAAHRRGFGWGGVLGPTKCFRIRLGPGPGVGKAWYRDRPVLDVIRLGSGPTWEVQGPTGALSNPVAIATGLGRERHLDRPVLHRIRLDPVPVEMRKGARGHRCFIESGCGRGRCGWGMVSGPTEIFRLWFGPGPVCIRRCPEPTGALSNPVGAGDASEKEGYGNPPVLYGIRLGPGPACERRMPGPIGAS
jgi:hypothetical protein